MTISNTDVRNAYVSGAGQTEFAYTFKVLVAAHMKVYVNDVLKTINSDYTLSGIADDAGGNVTFLSGLTSGDSVVFVRSVPLTQETDYVTNDSFAAEIHEKALDKLTMIAQESRSLMSDRVLTLPESSALTNIEFPASSTRAGKAVRWNATGDALEEIAIDPGVNVSVITAKGDLVTGDATGAAAKLSIGYQGKILRASDQSLPNWTPERKIDRQTGSVTLGNSGAGRCFLMDTSAGPITTKIPAPTLDNEGSVWTFMKISADTYPVTVKYFDDSAINGVGYYILRELFDHVTIVTNTQSPYSVVISNSSRPQIHHTSGVITRGSFLHITQDPSTTGVEWETGASWSIANNLATMDGGNSSSLSQTGVADIGGEYVLTYTISGRTASSVTPYLGTTAGTARSSNGTFEDTIIAAGSGTLFFTGDAGFDGSITNIHLRLKKTTAVIPADDTPPQISEGARALRIRMRPMSLRNRITLQANIYVNSASTNEIAAALYGSHTGNSALATGICKPTVSNNISLISINYSEVSDSGASRTYEVRVGGSTGDIIYIDGIGGSRRHGSVMKSNLLLSEHSY